MGKSIGTYYTEYFRMPHLYRDDVQAIERILKEDLTPQKFTISCGGQDYPSITAIPPARGTTHVLVIATQSPDVRLKFARSWTELHAGQTTDEMRKSLIRVTDILVASERRRLWALTRFTPWLAPLLCFGVVASIFGFIAAGVLTIRSLYGMSVWLALVVVWWAMGYYWSVAGSACIDLGGPRPPVQPRRITRGALIAFGSGLIAGATAVLLICR